MQRMGHNGPRQSPSRFHQLMIVISSQQRNLTANAIQRMQSLKQTLHIWVRKVARAREPFKRIPDQVKSIRVHPLQSV